MALNIVLAALLIGSPSPRAAWWQPLERSPLGVAAAAVRMESAAGLGLPRLRGRVVVRMLAVAMALRRPGRPRVLALSLLLTLTWSTHLVPAAVAGLICLVIAGTTAIGRRPSADPLSRRTARSGLRSVPVTAIGRVVPAGVPAAVLTVVFTARNWQGASPPQPDSLKQRNR